MTAKDITGEFSIIGSNQSDSDLNYSGILTLQLDENNRIHAKWLIHNEQEQTGLGFFNDNILVINFQYLDEDSFVYKGTVVYRCLTKDILDGFWSEEYGNPKFIGTERCFRIKEKIAVS